MVWFRYSKSNKGPQGPGGESGNTGATGATGANPLAGLITTTQGSKDVTFLGNVIVQGATGLTATAGNITAVTGEVLAVKIHSVNQTKPIPLEVLISDGGIKMSCSAVESNFPACNS